MRYLFISLFLFCHLGETNAQDFSASFDAALSSYISQGMVNYQSLSSNKKIINKLVNEISLKDLDYMSGDEKKAFLINAYNVFVISSILKKYPINSVQDIPNFFSQKHFIGSKQYSLDEIEKDLLNTKEDPRLHMALVCGAVSCPPLRGTSFKADNLEIELLEVSREALSSERILIVDKTSKKLNASKIFRWFSGDFGDVSQWINNYSITKYDKSYTLSHMDYDWGINQTTESENPESGVLLKQSTPIRYYSSNLYNKGQYEINMFNNYFTLLENDNQRINYLTSLVRYTVGLNKRINFVVEGKFRSVASGRSDNIGTFTALKLSNKGKIFDQGEEVSFQKIGLSAIIPRIKYQPFRSVTNLTFQHGVAIPIPFDQSQGFFDWGSPSMFHDAFYDYDVSTKASIFLQLGVYLENINKAFFKSGNGYYQFSTPLTFIYQYFPNNNTTFYALLNYAPQWGYSVSDEGNKTEVIPDSYNQYGLGFKQFINRKFQIELLWTAFNVARPNTASATYNIGIRYYGG